jgi:hypothetical protein
VSRRRVAVFGHHDVHGVVAAYIAVKAFGASEAFAGFPDTAPELVVQTVRRLFGSATEPSHIVLVDIPVDLKDPEAFVKGLEELAEVHQVTLIDHHESSQRFAGMFSRVRFVYTGPSALALNMYLLSMVPNPSPVDRVLAIVGAVADRDPEVIRRGLWSEELQRYADGLDVLVRRLGAQRVLDELLRDPVKVLREAVARADEVPVAQLDRVVGVVAVAGGLLPEGWGFKALERLAFATNALYAVGVGVDPVSRNPVVQAIIRWDARAKRPDLPLPGDVAKLLWPDRNVIGHRAAPIVPAKTLEEAKQMALQLAQAINSAVEKLEESRRNRKKVGVAIS